jgi:hypothetical protein
MSEPTGPTTQATSEVEPGTMTREDQIAIALQALDTAAHRLREWRAALVRMQNASPAVAYLAGTGGHAMKLAGTTANIIQQAEDATRWAAENRATHRGTALDGL